VGILRSVIEIPVLAVLHPRENLPLRCAVAFQLVRDDHARYIRQPLEEFAEEFLRRFLVPTTLDENIQDDVAVLVHGTPEVVPCPIDRQKHLIQMPFIARPWAPVTQLIGIGLPKLPAPLPDRFIRHEDPTGKQQLFDIPVAEAKAVIQSDAVADDLSRKSMVFVALRWGWRGHALLPIWLSHDGSLSIHDGGDYAILSKGWLGCQTS
jgi:hypothetical protein